MIVLIIFTDGHTTKGGILIGNLTLDQLRVLVAIVETGSFSAASKALSRAQSSISQAIASLEGTQGILLFDRSGHRPRLTEAGRVLVEHARLVLASAGRFEAVAKGTRSGLESELTIAIDPLVPTAPLIESLRLLRTQFPDLPVSFSTEGLGGSLRRLRNGTAATAICLLLPAVPEDVVAYPLLRIKMLPVVATGHPLAFLKRPVMQSDFEAHVQLVLSDPVEPQGTDYGIASARRWRFIDIGRRMDFLMAGFGWCRMPEHLVASDIAAGNLAILHILDDPTPEEGLTIYAAHKRSEALGPAGQWLMAELKQRFA